MARNTIFLQFFLPLIYYVKAQLCRAIIMRESEANVRLPRSYREITGGKEEQREVKKNISKYHVQY